MVIGECILETITNIFSKCITRSNFRFRKIELTKTKMLYMVTTPDILWASL